MKNNVAIKHDDMSCVIRLAFSIKYNSDSRFLTDFGPVVPRIETDFAFHWLIYYS